MTDDITAVSMGLLIEFTLSASRLFEVGRLNSLLCISATRPACLLCHLYLWTREYSDHTLAIGSPNLITRQIERSVHRSDCGWSVSGRTWHQAMRF
jgi:hypothetical protein